MYTFLSIIFFQQKKKILFDEICLEESYKSKNSVRFKINGRTFQLA